LMKLQPENKFASAATTAAALKDIVLNADLWARHIQDGGRGCRAANRNFHR
jgi:hypothetical protein